MIIVVYRDNREISAIYRRAIVLTTARYRRFIVELLTNYCSGCIFSTLFSMFSKEPRRRINLTIQSIVGDQFLDLGDLNV